MAPVSDPGKSAEIAGNTSSVNASGLYGQRQRTLDGQQSTLQTADSYGASLRKLERRLDDLTAQLEIHQVEAHARPLPNVVGWAQAQWQVIPAPVKGIVLTYLAMFIISATINFVRRIATALRNKSTPNIIGPNWPTA